LPVKSEVAEIDGDAVSSVKKKSFRFGHKVIVGCALRQLQRHTRG
jgi:hypothetical protein